MKSDGEMLDDAETVDMSNEVIVEETHKTKNDIIEDQRRIASAMRTARDYALPSTIVYCGFLTAGAIVMSLAPFALMLIDAGRGVAGIIAAFIAGVLATLNVQYISAEARKTYDEDYKEMLDQELNKLNLD